MLQVSEVVAQSGAPGASADVLAEPAQALFHSEPFLPSQSDFSAVLFLRVLIYKHTPHLL